LTVDINNSYVISYMNYDANSKALHMFSSFETRIAIEIDD